MKTIISELLLSSIEGILFLLLFVFFNDLNKFIRNNKLKCAVFVLIYSMLTNWPANYILPGVRTILILIFTAIILSLISKVSLFASIISVAITIVFFFSTEMVASLFPILILKIDLQKFFSTGLLRVIFGLTIKLLQLIFVLLLINSNLRIKKLLELKKLNSLYSLLILQVLLITVIMFSFYTTSKMDSNVLFYNSFLTAIYIIFLVLIFIDLKERERLQAIQYKFQAQEEYIGNMETIISIIRREKHDFSNHLNTVLAICALNKPGAMLKVENYIRKISNNIKSSYHFFSTGNDFIDGLLAVKSNFAFEHNIHLEVDFDVSLDSLNINDCDLTSIISNIIDNAFDAIISTDHSEGKVVSITTYEEDSQYYLSVSNNGPMISEKDINKIFDNGYSTKSSNKSDRGFGLYIVKQLVKRNGGTIEVKSTEEETEFLFKFKKGK